MTQSRTFDYASQDTTKSLNDHLVDLLPPGVYAGFTVDKFGEVAPGTLLTAEGVRINDTQPGMALCSGVPGVPVNATSAKRHDLVVCRHTWRATTTENSATYEILTGVDANGQITGDYPTLPDGCLPLAWCVAAGVSDGEWESVVQAGPPERLVNCTRTADTSIPLSYVNGKYTIVDGSQGALRLVYNSSLTCAATISTTSGIQESLPPGGSLALYMLAPDVKDGHRGDGSDITWGEPVFTLDATGITTLSASTGAAKIGVEAIGGAQVSIVPGQNVQSVIAGLLGHINDFITKPFVQTLMPASSATSSRRRPDTRRFEPYIGRPACCGPILARRDVRNSRISAVSLMSCPK